MRLRTAVLLAAVGLSAGTAAGQPASAQDAPAWLRVLNEYRAAGALPSLYERPDLTPGERKHSEYMLNNRGPSRYEEKINPWYSEEGDAAARNGRVEHWPDKGYSDRQVIDAWLARPFHQLVLLDPRLKGTAYAAVRNDMLGSGAATIDVQRGRGSPKGVKFPVVWPGEGSSIPLTTLGSGDEIETRRACRDLPTATGQPLVAYFSQDPEVRLAKLTRDGAEVERCVLAARSFQTDDAATTKAGRDALSAARAVVVVPMDRLLAGSRYTLRLDTTAGSAISTFTVTSGSIRPAKGAPAPATPRASVAPSAATATPRPSGQPESSSVPAARPAEATPKRTSAPVAGRSAGTPRPGATAGTAAGASQADPVVADPGQPASDSVEILLTEPSARTRTVPFTPPERGVDAVGWVAAGVGLVSWTTVYMVRRRRRGSSVIASVLWLRARLSR